MKFLVFKEEQSLKQKLLIKTRQFVNCERAQRGSGKFIDGFCKKLQTWKLEKAQLITNRERAKRASGKFWIILGKPDAKPGKMNKNQYFAAGNERKTI